MAMFGAAVGFVGGLIFAVIGILISSVLLWITAKLFKLKGGFSVAFMIALIVGVVSFLAQWILGLIPFIGAFLGPLVSLVLAIWLGITQIKGKYKVDTGKAVLVWLVWFIMSVVLGMIVGFMMAFLLVGAGIAMGGASMMGFLG
ncbi:hypothetical protein HY492_02440 [Candidatus Woesearchaeota archaeon]|nr:hypothetical protein [Candidatus Woesearchaeota archaeon]